MLNWDNRMKNNHSVKILKAIIPFLDVEIGTSIDMEGMLGAVRPFVEGRERHMLDMVLQFFQMRRMMEMMQLVQSMQQMSGDFDFGNIGEMFGGFKGAGEETEVEPEHDGAENNDSDPAEKQTSVESEADRAGSRNQNSGTGVDWQAMLRAFVPPEQASFLEAFFPSGNPVENQPEDNNDGSVNL